MYEPGDYVVGYPDIYFENGLSYRYNGGMIPAAKTKEALIKYCKTGAINRVWLTNNDYHFGVTTFDYIDVKGLVVAVDDMGSNKPHTEGVVKVLIGEEMLWFWARNIKPVRLATGAKR